MPFAGTVCNPGASPVPGPLSFAPWFAAGAVNSIAGGGTLLSFPTLIWLGRDPIVANATNAIALWPGSLAAMLGFRRELASAHRPALWLTAPSIVGGALGAALLLHTPSKVFGALVPYLILFATALFAAQRPITRALGPRTLHGASRHSWLLAAGFQLLVATYGGYFGAGMGIVMLAALALLGLADIHEANALKNLFAVCINGIAAALFVAGSAIDWPDAALMATGAIAGGFFGAELGRRLGREFVHRAVVTIGLAAALSMLLVLRRS